MLQWSGIMRGWGGSLLSCLYFLFVAVVKRFGLVAFSGVTVDGLVEESHDMLSSLKLGSCEMGREGFCLAAFEQLSMREDEGELVRPPGPPRPPLTKLESSVWACFGGAV